MKVKSIVVAVLLILGVTACEKKEIDPPSIKFSNEMEQSLIKVNLDIQEESSTLKAAGVDNWWESINESLVEHGIQLEKMETLGAEQHQGITIIFKDMGNKKLSSDFVPNDSRNGTGIDVPYIIDGTELGTTSGMTEVDTYNAIVNAMNTWDNNKCSSGLDIPLWGLIPFDVGFVQYLEGFGGYAGYLAGGITHGGILPAVFFDAIGGPGGGTSILGVTFTFIWTSDGVPTDINNDGKNDVAFREVYINDGFNWQDAPDDVLFNGIYDFETVVLHEVGHGLSQGHFGKAFITKNGMLHFAPAALMNSAYSVARREITQTDLAGHCSIWADWPNN